MAVKDGWVTRPSPAADPRERSRPRSLGLAIGFIGLMVVAVGAIANLVIAGDPIARTVNLPWAFGVSVTGLGVLKLGIAIVLVGIIVRLWHRVNSVKDTLVRIVESPPDTPPAKPTTVRTDHGAATVGGSIPKPLPIHRMAKTLWLPMLVMGVMALAIGFILSLATSAQTVGSADFNGLRAWSQGTLFLGEGLVLAGISFLLGTILAGLREGGAEVQNALGAAVKVLKMPGSAKAFVALMMLGTMLAIAQFVLYGVLAANWANEPATFAIWSTWLGPFREVALGVLLSGIVLALYTISKALGFQFSRIRELVAPAA